MNRNEPGIPLDPAPWVPPSVRLDGWGAFGAWALVGALWSLSVLGAASIGLFVLPLALLAAVVAAWTVQVWPGVLGLLEGVAALSLFVGTINVGSTQCPASGSATFAPGQAGTSTSCGGLDPVPWLVVGVAIAVLGLVAYPLARSARDHRSPSRANSPT